MQIYGNPSTSTHPWKPTSPVSGLDYCNSILIAVMAQLSNLFYKYNTLLLALFSEQDIDNPALLSWKSFPGFTGCLSLSVLNTRLHASAVILSLNLHLPICLIWSLCTPLFVHSVLLLIPDSPTNVVSNANLMVSTHSHSMALNCGTHSLAMSVILIRSRLSSLTLKHKSSNRIMSN
jgi:hypothetical protein